MVKVKTQMVYDGERKIGYVFNHQEKDDILFALYIAQAEYQMNYIKYVNGFGEDDPVAVEKLDKMERLERLINQLSVSDTWSVV